MLWNQQGFQCLKDKDRWENVEEKEVFMGRITAIVSCIWSYRILHKWDVFVSWCEYEQLSGSIGGYFHASDEKLLEWEDQRVFIPGSIWMDMIVFQKKSKGLEKNNTIIGSFKCYDKLNKCDIVRLCEKIEKYLNGDYKKIIRERENKQFLVVYKNGVNDSYFMVGILGDYLNYSFDLCYYLAYSINYHTRFPILEIENSRYDITKIMNTLGNMVIEPM